MRERITFIYPQGGGVDFTSLDIQDNKLQGPATEAVREHKVTLTLKELPSELAGLLQDIHELHLRWTGPSNYGTLEPFSSRLSPGLHLSYTPLKEEEHDPTKLCSLLQAFGSLECTSPEAFINLRDGRHASSPALYFYGELDNLDSFSKHATQEVCSQSDVTCKNRLRDLKTATSLDISFDLTSKSLKLMAFWPLGQHEILVPASPNGRTEVGILGEDVPPGIAPHEVGVSGVLTVVGEQKELSPALFAFPSRHRMSDSSFSAKFLSPTGLHPTLQLNLSTSHPPVEDAECAPHAYLTLPKAIFADRYQLADKLFLASKNLTATRYVSQPVDLEAPAYTTNTWGSNVLLELAPPSHASSSDPWTVEVPLHLRYLKPSATGTVEVEVPYPVVFWACDSGEGIDFTTNPFDRVNLGYDGFFGPTTAFWHVGPKPEVGGRLMNTIAVPVVKDEASQWVTLGTAAAVGLGFIWVLLKLAGVYKTSGYGSTAPRGQEGKKNK